MGRLSLIPLGPSFAPALIPTRRPRPILTTSATFLTSNMPTPVHTSSSPLTTIGAIVLPTQLTWTSPESLAMARTDTPLILSPLYVASPNDNQSLTKSIVFLPSLQIPRKGSCPTLFEAGKAKRVRPSANCFHDFDTDRAIGAFHLATTLSLFQGYSGFENFS